MQWPRSHSGCLVLLDFQGKQGISLPQHLILFYLLSCLALPATAQCLARPTRGANSCFAAGTTAVSCPRGVDCQFSLPSREPSLEIGGCLLCICWGSSLAFGLVGLFPRIGVQGALLPSRHYNEHMFGRGGKALPAEVVFRSLGVSAINLNCCHMLQQALRTMPLRLFGLACSIGLGFPPLLLWASGSRGEGRCLPIRPLLRQVNAFDPALHFLSAVWGR